MVLLISRMLNVPHNVAVLSQLHGKIPLILTETCRPNITQTSLTKLRSKRDTRGEPTISLSGTQRVYCVASFSAQKIQPTRDSSTTLM